MTNCHQLKLEAADGKKYLTDTANAETLLRLIQSVPNPKAEPKSRLDTLFDKVTMSKIKT